ncbi:uncharacterized protein BP01DRAFT_159672 [Aspergillus saccharolyticus JOP 1030-1]|uniref:Uncharacterized protein n=1 Tax=Aspergillus saccharolyticus JOP 1030-1 TaxID=1450539 RepID=A0A318Z3E7_9EURO|nr:hypothetical protein BP01DRAFT_159672 [Aspergillus saccharolyticus JOP 1030-1]PYH41841.1 hypothetical protein BP01DRAFT_159672 [Aspergillus saccharolyticus JOP 1030-1]
MDYQIDVLATANDWVQGSPTRPYTGIVSLYMADQLSAETAAREIVSVINAMYYGGDSGLVEQNLNDLWRTIAHTSRTLLRSICPQQPSLNEDDALADSASLTTPTAAQPDVQPDGSHYPPTQAQHKLLTLLQAIRTFPITEPIPGTVAGISHHHHPSLSPYLGATVFSSSSSYYGSSLSSNHSDWEGMLADDVEARTKCKRGICWAALPFFREVIAEIFQEDAPGKWFRRPSPPRYTAPTSTSATSQFIGPLSTASQPETMMAINPSPPFYSTQHPTPTHFNPPMPKVSFGTLESEAWLNLTSFLAIMSKESVHDGLDDIALVMMGSVLGNEGKTLFAPASGLGSYAHGPVDSYYPFRQTQPENHADCITTKPCLDLYVSAAAIWAILTGEEIWQRRGEGASNDFVVGLTLDGDDDGHDETTLSPATTFMSLRSRIPDAASAESCPPDVSTSPFAASSKPTSSRSARGDSRDAISRRTWDAWIGCFRAAGCREDLAASTRSIAAEAAEVMLRACTQSSNI